MPYLAGAARIEIVDPYLCAPHQLRNLYELLVDIIVGKPADQTVAVHVLTGGESSREDWQQAQLIGLSEIKDAC